MKSTFSGWHSKSRQTDEFQEAIASVCWIRTEPKQTFEGTFQALYVEWQSLSSDGNTNDTHSLLCDRNTKTSLACWQTPFLSRERTQSARDLCLSAGAIARTPDASKVFCCVHDCLSVLHRRQHLMHQRNTLEIANVSGGSSSCSSSRTTPATGTSFFPGGPLLSHLWPLSFLDHNFSL